VQRSGNEYRLIHDTNLSVLASCLSHKFILGQQLLLHPFNSLFSRITWVSRYLKGKTSLNLNEARDGSVFGRQWHQLDHLHIAPDNYSNTPSLSFSGRVIFLTPNHVKALKGMSKHDRLTEIIYSYNHSRAAMPKGFANRFLRNPSDLAHCDNSAAGK